MNDYTRNFCLSEFNRLLPMVRESIKKERVIDKLQDELNSRTDTYENVEEALKNLDWLLSNLPSNELTAEQKTIFIKLKEHFEKKKSKHHTIIVDLNDRISRLTEQYSIEKNLYMATMKLILSNLDRYTTPNGFVKVQDIQTEYLEEYIYLLSLYDSFSPSLTIDDLFVDSQSKLAFFTSISKKYSDDLAYRFKRLVEYNQLNNKAFFELFP